MPPRRRRRSDDWWDDGLDERRPRSGGRLGVWHVLGLVGGGLIVMAALGQLLATLTVAAKNDAGYGIGYFCGWVIEFGIGVALMLPGLLKLLSPREPDPYD